MKKIIFCNVATDILTEIQFLVRSLKTIKKLNFDSQRC